MTISHHYLLAAALLAAAPMAAIATAPDDLPESAAKLDGKAMAKLSRLVEGRERGKPVSCIAGNRVRQYSALSDDLLMYRTHDGTVYLNAPHGGCNGAKHNAIVSVRPVSTICSGDILTVEDLTVGMTVGSCALGEFIPYRKDIAKGD
ncbi:MAG: hypothetical protein R3E02_14260 [Blastomonas sp.]